VFMKQSPENTHAPNRYSVDHSAALAVIDPKGRMAGMIPPDHRTHSFNPQAIAADFIKLHAGARR
ncbi:MAG: hypothetical protein Q4G62_12235, partial [Pseudomonadota bacterium]|nr:hypothetical protein [Pseudomonadota bacterium]